MSAIPATTTTSAQPPSSRSRSWGRGSPCVRRTDLLPAAGIWRGADGASGIWRIPPPAWSGSNGGGGLGSRVGVVAFEVGEISVCGRSFQEARGGRKNPPWRILTDATETRFCRSATRAVSSPVGAWGGNIRGDQTLSGGWIALEFEEFDHGGGQRRSGIGRRRTAWGSAAAPERIHASYEVIATPRLDRNEEEEEEEEEEEGAAVPLDIGEANWEEGSSLTSSQCDGRGSFSRQPSQCGAERTVGRRVSLFLLVASAAAALAAHGGAGVESASAFSPGFSGLKDWLKGQKQKTAGFLLAPIFASRDRLASALLLVSSETVSPASYQEAGKLVKVAARDCMPATTGTFQDFQKRSGVEVCTFKLVLKNAASLRDNDDPVKLNAEESLTKLVRLFISLDEMLASGAAGGALSRGSILGAMSDASQALAVFEGNIRTCLDIA